MRSIDQVIVSSDQSPRFLNFWPLVAKSWKDLFNISPTLVLVSNHAADSQLLNDLRSFGSVVQLDAIPRVPLENQAKLARWYYACQAGDLSVTIEDIDTIFLTPDYLEDRLRGINSETLRGIGSDVSSYTDLIGDISKFPASNFTGTGILFSQLFNYQLGMSFRDFVWNFKDLKNIDERANPFSPPYVFSDESLIRALRIKNDFQPIEVVPRDVNIHEQWIDRSWWPSSPPINLDKYICVNLLRPLWENRDACKFILDEHFEEGYPWIIDQNEGSIAKLRWRLRDARITKFRRLLLKFLS